MRTHTSYVGIKIKPQLKRRCEREARKMKVGLSEWIRYAMIAASTPTVTYSGSGRAK